LSGNVIEARPANQNMTMVIGVGRAQPAHPVPAVPQKLDRFEPDLTARRHRTGKATQDMTFGPRQQRRGHPHCTP
jgi:hypothetical protein